MIYSIIKMIYHYNLGREYSTIKRQHAFNQLGIKSKILTRGYNTTQYYQTQINDLDYDHDVINMYDYFQEASSLSKHKPWRARNLRHAIGLDLKNYLVDICKDGTIDYYKNDVLVMKARPLPNSYSFLGSVEYYDLNGNITMSEQYDWRGFCSSVQYFHNNQLIAQNFLSPDGKVKLEMQVMNNNNQLEKTLFKLIDYKGQNYLFANENELFTFFVQNVIANKPGTILVDDVDLAESLNKVDTFNQPKFLYIHYNHVALDNIKVASNYSNFFINNAPYYSGVIVPTEMQASDLRMRINADSSTVRVLPDNIALDNVLSLPIHSHDKNDDVIHIGYFGDLSSRVRSYDDFLSICQKIKDGSQRKIDFTVYSNINQVSNWENKADKAGLAQDIHFMNPITSYRFRNEIQNKIDIVISPSVSDGGNMMVTDALAFGKPVVAYQAQFGNAEYLRNHKNALLSDINNKDGFAKNVIKLIDNDNLRNQLSQSAKNTAKKTLSINSFKKLLEKADIINDND